MFLPITRLVRACLPLLALPLVVACDLQHESRHVSLLYDAGEPSSENSEVEDPPAKGPLDENGDDLFDPDALHTFELRLEEEDLAFLDQDPKAEHYVPGELLFERERVRPVGIRYKGSTGSFVGCLSGNFFPPTGSKVCPKLGMKIKIDYGDPKARFHGQKKLLFHAMNADRSLMRERLGYTLYREMGVHSSRTAHMRLLINGRFVGLFLLVEEVDDRFTKSRFDDGGEGNLYKEVWPLHDERTPYLAALETNRGRLPSVDKMVALASALNGADDEGLPQVIADWMDGDYVARFVAVDRTIRHDDGPYHWYCQPLDDLPFTWHRQHRYGEYWCGNHNYYWYEEEDADRVWPVPWDLDGAMPNRAGFTNISSRWDDLSSPCTELLPSTLGTGQMPISCDPLQRGWALALDAQIRSAMDELAQGPLSEAAVSDKLARWSQQIEEVVAEASALYPREPTPTTWRAELDLLRATLARLRAEAELSAAR